MKKLVSLILSCFLLLGSLSALAASEEVMPLGLCRHEADGHGTYIDGTIKKQIACFVYEITYKVKCDGCDLVIDYDGPYTGYNTTHHGSPVVDTEIHDGQEVRVKYCSECGGDW